MNFKTRNKLTVGLTGGILCGKSTALAAWQQAGAYTLSCDALVREISARTAVQKKIQSLLGATGREQLARQVFSRPAQRKQLEALLHPLVAREIKKRLAAAPQPLRVVEVPLLFEAGWADGFDMTVAICAPEKKLLSRAGQRGLSKTDFLKRRQAQWPPAKKAAHADICLMNDGTRQSLERKIRTLHSALHTFIQ